MTMNVTKMYEKFHMLENLMYNNSFMRPNCICQRINAYPKKFNAKNNIYQFYIHSISLLEMRYDSETGRLMIVMYHRFR